ncbi:hypothetical protein GQ42DRAFT_79952 [Ramicandelaber brevisporus]|nr:hypothetical protein GQ42DRAFT_79952 [Ramicandelaber brevisporus]
MAVATTTTCVSTTCASTTWLPSARCRGCRCRSRRRPRVQLICRRTSICAASFVRSLTHSFIHSLTYPFLCLPACLLVYSLSRPVTYSPTHLSVYPPICPLIYPHGTGERRILAHSSPARLPLASHPTRPRPLLLVSTRLHSPPPASTCFQSPATSAAA